jgi:methylmalonyl-CoA mutase
MTASADGLTLGADFPAATAGQWRSLALAALRKSGAATEDTGIDDVDELLATVTYDGPHIAALHTAEDPAPPPAGLPGQWPFVRGARASGGVVAGWDVRQQHAGADAKEVRAGILDDLENGATSIWLTTGDDALPIAALPDALDGVHLDLAGLTLDPGDAFVAAGAAFFDLLTARGLAPSADGRAGGRAGGQAGGLTGGLGADPLGWQARTGHAGDVPEAVALARRCVAEAPAVRAITVDATVHHDAGGSHAEELGCAAAAGVAYLRAMTDSGLPVPAALGQLEFRYAATADQFATIAKLRAARRIWARIAEMCDAPHAGGQRQHAVTSAAMMTARDPWVNLLRTTIAAFAAGVGGADAVTVLPYDHRLGRSDAAARRLARNTQLLLIEEAHVARVLDPAGGSWYVERYTEELAQAGWAWFTEIERAGGLAAALDNGLVAERLARTWERRAANIAHRRDPITGVSEFPHLAETLPQRTASPLPVGGGLPRHRYAEAFELLRDRSDAQPLRPAVRLATLGPAAAHGPRVTFAANLFAAGGIALTSADGPAVACICGPDKAYPDGVAPLVAELRRAGVKRIWLAGKGDYPGVDGNIFTGCDAVEVLTTTLADLGVPE